MNAKGTLFLARKKMVVDRVGTAAEEFIRAYALQAPVFAAPIVATTVIPLEEMLKLQEASASGSAWARTAARAMCSPTAGASTRVARLITSSRRREARGRTTVQLGRSACGARH